MKEPLGELIVSAWPCRSRVIGHGVIHSNIGHRPQGIGHRPQGIGHTCSGFRPEMRRDTHPSTAPASVSVALWMQKGDEYIA